MTVILVEGVSDQLALEALARRRGRDLEEEGVSIVPIGGAQAIAKHVERFHPEVRLVGLCDAGEQRFFRRAFERVGITGGVFVCHQDLEDELVRALGVERVEEVLAANDRLGFFRSFQQQPAWRGRDPAEQLHRFIPKNEFLVALVDALDLDQVPRPLDAVLAQV